MSISNLPWCTFPDKRTWVVASVILLKYAMVHATYVTVTLKVKHSMDQYSFVLLFLAPWTFLQDP